MSSVSEPTSAETPSFFAQEMRVDPPHAGPRRVLQPAGERVAASAVASGEAVDGPLNAATSIVEHSLEQLREHAAQLADRLQTEQSTLDRRHSELEAQEADLEAKWENARQWLAERQQELDDRAASFDSREHEIAEREAAAETRCKELTKVREEALAEREFRLQNTLADIEQRESEIQDRLKSLDEDRAAWDERNDRLQEREAAVEARHRELDQRQAQLYGDIDDLIADKARAEDR